MAAVTKVPESGCLIVASPYRAQEAAKLGLDHMLRADAPRDTLYRFDLNALLLPCLT